MLEKLKFIYGDEKGETAFKELQQIILAAKEKINCEGRELWNEKDIFLITYADSFSEKNKPPLPTLQKFLQTYTVNQLTGLHILPFYPYSSDRGFSVSNFYQVKKEFGSWQDIENLAKDYRLMADLVLNHVSVRHEWFQKFLAGDKNYWDYFIHFDQAELPQEEELNKVFRPRATPLLTPFQTTKGERWVWTTFSVENSTDQIDLNYKNPEVLLEMIKIMLFYLEKGIRLFRLDSTPYVWKEIGTDCKSLPQTHALISIFHDTLKQVCRDGLVLTQSSTSFGENLLYLKQDAQESDLIYNFALPPLLLQAIYTKNSQHLRKMAQQMKTPPNGVFLNILAVHDGIGVNGAKEFLSESELSSLYKTIEESGGKLAFRNLSGGKKTVVELVTTWWSALNPSTSLSTSSQSFELQLQKFVTSHAIALALKGIPAVYYLSLFGKKNDLQLAAQTGIKRDLNRSTVEVNNLSADEKKVLESILALIQKRKSYQAFHPNADQEVLDLDERIFAIVREGRGEKVLALHNLSGEQVRIKYRDKSFILDPYAFIWEKI